MTAKPQDIPSHTRWSWIGGRRIHLGDEPRAGQVVVAGRGEFSHRSLDCPALREGRLRTTSKKWTSGGFYSVPVELADRFVDRCPQSWTGDEA